MLSTPPGLQAYSRVRTPVVSLQGGPWGNVERPEVVGGAEFGAGKCASSRSRLKPFVKLARTIRHYRPSIEATIEYEFANGIAEANNSVTGRTRRNANGFHNPRPFITMIMLNRGGLGPNLPWTP